MAPDTYVGDPPSFFLSPLDKCFAEGHELISWKVASEALSNLALVEACENLRLFFLDELTQDALSSDFELFKSPSPQSKSAFETKTAEINITPSSNNDFDTNQIKQDALWLSRQAKIDEIWALRIVILEWQNRQAAQLLEGYSEEEIITVKQAIGTVDFPAQYSKLGPNRLPFNAEDKRHARLLRLVLSEQEHLLQVSIKLRVEHDLGSPTAPPDRTYRMQKKGLGDALAWIPDLVKRADGLVDKEGRNMSHDHQGSRNFITDGIRALEKMLVGWESGSQWSAELDHPNEFELQYRESQLRQMVLTFQLIAVRVASLESYPSAAALQSWFEFVDKYGFFELFQAQSSGQVPFIGLLQGLVSLVSLQLLRVPYTIAYLNNPSSLAQPSPIIHDSACRFQIDQTIRNAVTRTSVIASPAAFGWSMILQTLRNRIIYATDDLPSDDETSLPESGSPNLTHRLLVNVPADFVEALDSIVKQSPDGDPIEMYAKVAVDDCSVLSVLSILSHTLIPKLGSSSNRTFQTHARLTLLELARQAVCFIDYKAEILECVLAILEGDQDFEDDSLGFSMSTRAELATIFMDDNDVLVPRLLHQAYGRYPYETAPLLKLCNALVQRKIPRGSEVQTSQPLCDPTPYFTQQLPKGFDGYELVREDEFANGIRLTESLPLISHRRPRQAASLRNLDHHNALPLTNSNQGQGEFYIPAGTTGTVISESRPFVIAWDYTHSPLRYLACLLSTTTAGSDRKDIFSDSALENDSQADVISIFAKLLDAPVITDGEAGTTLDAKDSRALWVLEEASDILERNQDIISVIFEIFERELSQPIQQRREGTLTTLTSCIEFFRAALKVVPGRIWPLLARSELLELGGRGGRISAVVSAESSSGSCKFVRACLSLYSALRQDILNQSVSGKIPSTVITTRFSKEDDLSPRIPKKVVAEIILAFSHTFTSVLQSLQDWPLKSLGLKPALTANILGLFGDIILDTYGCDDAHTASQKLCGSLAPAAKYIFDSFVISPDNGLVSNALIANLLPPNPSIEQDLICSSLRNKKLCVGVVLDFTKTLLDLGTLFDTKNSYLDQQLFLAVPLLVRLYSAEETHKNRILLLFSSLVRKAGMSESKPMSLLGYLGADSTRCFLTELRRLERPLGDLNKVTSIWDLASAATKNRQQWFASFLITGDTPKDSLKRMAAERQGYVQHKTLLSTCIDTIPKTMPLETPLGYAMLRFVLQAQNYWPWVTQIIHQHTVFLTNMTDYVAALTSGLSNLEFRAANQTYVASLIAEILAMYLHNMRQLGDVSLLKTLTSKLSFYLENAVAAPKYNSSLHVNLQRNLTKTFPGCDVNSFKRLLGTVTFAEGYCYYNLPFAARVLGYHQAWKGSNGRGFENELERASKNLSRVEAQVLLLGSWKSLCVELCHNLTRDKSLQKQMITVVNRCLVSNIESNLPEAIFEHLLQTRAELALVIMQRLVNVRSEIPSIKTLLGIVWDAIRASGQNFEISGTLTNYYRTLLRILLLALQPHIYLGPGKVGTEQPVSVNEYPQEFRDRTIPTLIEIATEVAAKGFRSLCAQVHDGGATALPSDFGLVTSVLQNILCVRGVSEAHVQLTLQMCDTGIHRYALALFSWSERLTSGDEDPIFGELSISFLRELSNIPPMAEFLASEGIFSQIGTAAILSHLRSSNTEHVASHIRLLQIWSNGVLPLILNVLIAVGDPIALETMAFLNSFPAQLKRSRASLSTAAAISNSNPLAGRITLSSAKELHTLSMISRALDKYQESPSAAAAAGSFSQELDWDKTGVKEDLEAWLQGKRVSLRNRTMPSSERELELQKTSPLGVGNGGEEGCESRLEEAVVRELKGALKCLGGEP